MTTGEPSGHHGSDGTVDMQWNSQGWKLEGPPYGAKFPDKDRRHWLPCDGCGKAQLVWWSVVSTLCLECSDAKLT